MGRRVKASSVKSSFAEKYSAKVIDILKDNKDAYMLEYDGISICMKYIMLLQYTFGHTPNLEKLVGENYDLKDIMSMISGLKNDAKRRGSSTVRNDTKN